MKKKTKKVKKFLKDLHSFLVKHPRFRKKTSSLKEREMQAEIGPLIIEYLGEYFHKNGYKDYKRKAHSSFYYERSEDKNTLEKHEIFGSRNYPDFIIKKPYLIGIEYKKGNNGSLVKMGIGQSLILTMSEEFDFAYYLFYDESKEGKIMQSVDETFEKKIIKQLWEDFNIKLEVVNKKLLS